MIVRQDKTYETCSLYPNINWYENEDNYVVDETTEEGQILAKKIIEHSPYMELVVENGKLVDIIPLPKPDPPIVDEPVDDEKVAMAEAIIDLNNRISELEQKLEGGK